MVPPQSGRSICRVGAQVRCASLGRWPGALERGSLPIGHGEIDARRTFGGDFGLELFEPQLQLGDLLAKLLERLCRIHALAASKSDGQHIDHAAESSHISPPEACA